MIECKTLSEVKQYDVITTQAPDDDSNAPIQRVWPVVFVPAGAPTPQAPYAAALEDVEIMKPSTQESHHLLAKLDKMTCEEIMAPRGGQTFAGLCLFNSADEFST